MNCASYSRRIGLALLAAGAIGGVASPARAEPPRSKAAPVYVLSLWTDDVDDQADALTQALRSRVRQVQGWSLLETSQSFETLSIALKCPTKPDAACLQRIGDQIHADHFVWGTIAHNKKTAGEVTAELHLWTRGKSELEATESFSDNLKDPGDEALHEVAGKLFGKLVGTGPAGTLVVHAGSEGGTVLVDGAERATLDGGTARVDVGAGSHTVTVHVPGFESRTQQSSVPVGQEQDVNFSLSAAATTVLDGTPHTPFPARKVAGYTAVVVGAGFLAAGVVEMAAWIKDDNVIQIDRQKYSESGSAVCGTQETPAETDACHRSHTALDESRLGWIFGGVGVVAAGTGVILLLTSQSANGAPHDAVTTGLLGKPNFEVTPTVGPHGGALDMRLTF